MNSRERVLRVLNHQEADRVPFDLGGTAVTGIHVKAYQALRKLMGLPIGEQEIVNISQQLARVEEDVVTRLKADVKSVSPGPASNFKLEFEERGEYTWYYDEFKIGKRKPREGGWYFDFAEHPLGGDITIDQVDQFPWPDPLDPARFAGLRERTLAVIEGEKRAVVVSDLCSGIFESYSYIRGFNDFYTDLAANHLLAGRIMDHFLELKLAFWDKAFEILGDTVDVVMQADDLAGQHGLLFSPRTYRAIVKPRQKELFDFIHARSKAKVFFHSCGAVRPLIPDLIEVGVDILNPVQVSAVGMDTAELKREFGKDLCFWGGGVDTQQVLGSGDVQQVRDEVKRRIDDLMPGGGFVFGTVHNIQGNVPPENIMAMWETLQEYGVYA